MPQLDSPGLDANSLKSEISGRIGAVPVNLVYLDSCESTNTECLKLGEHNSVVVAEQQSAGRGRRGNNWHSPLTQNIYCSIGLNKTIQASYLGLISLQVGVCIASVLRKLGYLDVSLKWPNDILVLGKKLGGILIETRQISPDNFYLVIGFGLNLNLDESELAKIHQPAISLDRMSSEKVDRQRLLAELISHIMQQVMNFDLHMIDSLLLQFNQLDSFLGKQVVVKTRTEEINGVHLGIHQTGQIQVETARGLQTFSAADISLRGNANATDR